MACDLSEFPPELSSPLLSFVAVTGLDIVHNAVHRAIWDLLAKNRQADGVPIRFSLLEGDHEYPRCKPKRSSYEWYVPKGILNINWMNKHLYKVPALVVVFFDLDWDEMAWSEKLIELRSKIQIVRTSVEGRNTKIAVVLIQRSVPLPPGEDLIATDRATALCSTCDLSGKVLYVFPHTDHMYGYALRLENAFYELAQSYYLQQAKLVKSHREHLNKITHQLLFVRHQFKMGFFNELKCDSVTALRNYKQAYTNLLEIRTTDTNISEVKMISGFINYKICKLCFNLNTPLDSISQFRKHIDIFKNRVGPEDLGFEHCAWMAKQFSSFGDLFEDAIKLGLAAIQTQHPGFYYQQAALHAVARRKRCQEICEDNLSSVNMPLNSTSIEYYGQRPWRPGIQTIEPPDLQLERDGINALRLRELKEVNHATLIIPLLSSALVQFKKYRCPKMKRYLVVQMGEEYYEAKDYNKALTLLFHVVWDYRNEKWWSLLTHILKIAFKCAYLTASVQEFITICLEMLSPHVILNQDEKERFQENLTSVLSNGVPKPNFDLNEEAAKAAEELWRRDLTKIKVPFVYNIEINQLTSFVECKAMFSTKTVCVDQLVSLKVYLRLSLTMPIRFSKLSVVLSNPYYNDNCTLTDSKALPHCQNGYVADLLLEPGKTKVVPFTFVPLPSDAGQQLQISAVSLYLGDDSGRYAVLTWKNNTEVNSSSLNTFTKNDIFERETVYPQLLILPRESHLKLKVEHDAPALVNEFYSLNISLNNCEKSIIDSVLISFSHEDALDVSLYVDSPTSEKVSNDYQLLIGKMNSGDEIKKIIYLKYKEECSYNLTVKVLYTIHLEVKGQIIEYKCTACEKISLSAIMPFNVSIRTLSPKMELLDVVWCEEPFINCIEIKSSSPWPLILKLSSLKLDNPKMDQVSTHIQDVILNSGDSACECHYLTFPCVEDGTWTIGTYSVTWKRKSAGEIIPAVQSFTVLPSLTVLRIPISLDLDLPTHGFVRTPLTVTYRIHNKSSQIQEYDFCMDSSDSFMFAGHKQAHFKILPDQKLVLAYNLYPLTSGFVDLPRLRLLTHDAHYDAQLDGIVQKSLPEQIFIMPQSKKYPIINASQH